MRAVSHWLASQARSRRPGSSALAMTTGDASSATTWRTSVVFPTRRGPATTWMNRRGSRSRPSSVAKTGRRYGGRTDELLNTVSKTTQRAE